VTDPATVAKAYMHAWVSKDFRTLRGLLADDVTFSGPFAQLDNADDCLDGLRQLAEIVTDIVVHEQLADDTDVITWFDLHTTVAPPVPTANWSHVEAGQITSIRVTFDPRPLLPPPAHD
jgi:SnoaL-like domain